MDRQIDPRIALLRAEFNQIIPEFEQNELFMMNSTRLELIKAFYQKLLGLYSSLSCYHEFILLVYDVFLSFKHARYDRLKDVYRDLGISTDDDGYRASEVVDNFPKGW